MASNELVCRHNLGSLLVALLFSLASLPMAAAGGPGYPEDDQPPLVAKHLARSEIEIVSSLVLAVSPAVALDGRAEPIRIETDAILKDLEKLDQQKLPVSWLYDYHRRILGKLCEGHSTLFPIQEWRDYLEGQKFSEPLRLENGKVFFTAASGSHLAGAQILDINGIDGTQIYRILRSRLNEDSCIDEFPITLSKERLTPIMTTWLGRKSQYDVKIRVSGSAEIKTITIPANVEWLRAGPDSRKWTINNLNSKRFWPIIPITSEDMIYRYNRERGIAYLHPPAFRDLSSAYTGDRRLFDRSEVGKVMRNLIESDARLLILDLRSNSGGSLNHASYFLSFLLPKAHRLADVAYMKARTLPLPQYLVNRPHFTDQFQKNRSKFWPRGNFGLLETPILATSFGHPSFKGRVAVLIDQSTYSAAAKIAGILRKEIGATIIGERTLTRFDRSCVLPGLVYRLPHSDFLLELSYICYVVDNPRDEERGVVAPDFLVRQTKETFEAKIDAPLYHALSLPEN